MNNDRFKFRVWDKLKQKYISENVSVTTRLNRDGLLFIDGSTKAHIDNFVIVEFCTGLKDKNGNLIYDGDRVQKDGYIGTVKFGTYSKNDCGGKDAILGLYIEWDNAPHWRKDFNYWVREGVEIIGNIHEQAEQKD